MRKDKVNWGILGLGTIANVFAHDLKQIPSCKLIGVASRDLEKAKKFASAYHSENYYDSYQELVNNTSIDIIYIATPHVFHFQHAMLCLNNNKAVLCEKPFAINAFEVKKLVATAKAKKLFLMEAMWTRFFPCTDWLINTINSGEIGTIKTIEANFGFKASKDLESRLFNPNLGGGSLMDIGIYPVFLTLLLLGIPTHIEASATIFNKVDATCDMTFFYNDEQKALLKSTFLEDTSNEAIITGSKGVIKIHKNFFIPKTITLTKPPSTTKTLSIDYTGNGYYHEIVEASKGLLENKYESLKMPHKISIELITVLDRIREHIGLTYPNDKIIPIN